MLGSVEQEKCLSLLRCSFKVCECELRMTLLTLSGIVKFRILLCVQGSSSFQK